MAAYQIAADQSVDVGRRGAKKPRRVWRVRRELGSWARRA